MPLFKPFFLIKLIKSCRFLVYVAMESDIVTRGLKKSSLVREYFA
jgi:hypothetical protein